MVCMYVYKSFVPPLENREHVLSPALFESILLTRETLILSGRTNFAGGGARKGRQRHEAVMDAVCVCVVR